MAHSFTAAAKGAAVAAGMAAVLAGIQVEGQNRSSKMRATSNGDTGGSRVSTGGSSGRGGGPSVDVGQVSTPGVMTTAEAGRGEYSPDWWNSFQGSSTNTGGGGGVSWFGYANNATGLAAFIAYRSGGSLRLTKGGRLSIKHYASGWTGGSRARITTHNLTKWGSKLGARSSIVGIGYSSIELVNSDMSWGDYGRFGVSSLSSGLTLTPEPISTVFGLGVGFTDAAGGFNSFYNYLDANQIYYNTTGRIYVPFPY